MKRESQKRKMEVEPSSPNQHLDKGLCACCRGASTCTYPKVPDLPTLECDEFNGILPPPSKRRSLIRNVSSVPPRGVMGEPAPRGLESLEPRGLCSHCEEYATCTYPKLEGGVWHCEEYR